jgi:TRAP-type C4-dicarboxylate transport system substrate-binding protein
VKKILLALLLVALSGPALAQGVTIKLGTLAPQGSTWHDLLREMGQRWEEASAGAVKLRIYAGGTQGSEGDMVRKMAVGQLQAAAISNVGMHDMVAEPQGISVPFLFQDEAQMQCAFKRVRPQIEKALEGKGYVAVQWSTIGAIQLFCDKPHKSPADMGDAKIWAWEGDPKSVEAFRAAGLKPQVLSSADIVPSLQTGMINCLPNVPLYVLTARLYEQAPYMMDTTWAYMIGATLVRKDAWEKISPDLRPKLLSIAQELGDKVDAEVRRLNQDAVAAMQKQGLKVVPGDAAAWRAAMEKTTPILRGGVVPAEFYDQLRQARDACQSEAKK